MFTNKKKQVTWTIYSYISKPLTPF